MLLAGDVGGTKTILGLFSPAGKRPVVERVATFVTLQHAGLEEIIESFLDGADSSTVTAACFGVAGPVSEQRARLTNVPWTISSSQISSRFAFRSVTLLNDLQAMAAAVSVLEPRELAVLQQGRPTADGNAGLIAAGTGLGEAMLHRVGTELIPAPSEAGHADYSPRTAEEIEFMRMLVAERGRAEWEQVLSGPGLLNLHRFTHTQSRCEVLTPDIDRSHAPSVISQAAIEGRCANCVRALKMFVASYGAEAGNLALRCVATSGIFIGGGIAPKILSEMQTPTFLDAFRSKPPLAGLLESVPVYVILNDQAGLVGAAVFANSK